MPSPRRYSIDSFSMTIEQYSSSTCSSHARMECLGRRDGCSSADASAVVEDTNNNIYNETHPITSSSHTMWTMGENLDREAGGCPTEISTPFGRECCSRRATDIGHERPQMDSVYDYNRFDNHMSENGDFLEEVVGFCNMSPRDVSLTRGQTHGSSGRNECLVVDDLVPSTSRLPSREILYIFEMAYPGVRLSDEEDTGAVIHVNRSSDDDGAQCRALDQCVPQYAREDVEYTESQYGIDVLMSNLAEDQHDEYEVHPHGAGCLCCAVWVAPAA